MKSPILLACALITAMTLSGVAQEQVPAVEAGKPKQVRRERANRGPLTEEKRKAMMDKRLERIKEKDEVLHKELVELREKDPEAFRTRMREMTRARGQANRQKAGQGIGQGNVQGRGPKAGRRERPKKDEAKDEQ